MRFNTLKECVDFLHTQPGDKVPEILAYAMDKFTLYTTDETAFYKTLCNPAIPDNFALDFMLTDEFFNKYEQHRTFGLSPIEAGRAQGVAPAKMSRIVNGCCIQDYRLYKRLCEIEISAPVQSKLKALEALYNALESNKVGLWAAQTILNSKKKDGTDTDKPDYEARAQQALEELRKIRANRQAKTVKP